MEKLSLSEKPLPCPFCGKAVDLDDPDTCYPSGSGWLDDEGLQLRTYHPFRAVPPEQRCYAMHCPTPSGGCGAEIHGDTKEEALAKWNTRANAGAGMPEVATKDLASAGSPTADPATLTAHTPDLLRALMDCEARLALLVASGRAKMLDAVAAERARAVIAAAQGHDK